MYFNSSLDCSQHWMQWKGYGNRRTAECSVQEITARGEGLFCLKYIFSNIFSMGLVECVNVEPVHAKHQWYKKTEILFNRKRALWCNLEGQLSQVECHTPIMKQILQVVSGLHTHTPWHTRAHNTYTTKTNEWIFFKKPNRPHIDKIPIFIHMYMYT